MLQAYNFQSEILESYHLQGKELPAFHDSMFLDDFAILLDMLNHLNELNTKLQGNNKLVSDLPLYECCGWLAWLFLSYGKHSLVRVACILASPPDLERCAEVIHDLKVEVEAKFEDFKALKSEVCFFSCSGC